MASTILSLFPTWARAAAESNRTGDVDEAIALEDEIVALPARDLREFAAKLITVCEWDNPEGFHGARAKALLAEARALVVS